MWGTVKMIRRTRFRYIPQVLQAGFQITEGGELTLDKSLHKSHYTCMNLLFVHISALKCIGVKCSRVQAPL